MEHQKAKSAAKIVVPRGDKLKKAVLETAATIANVVGGTLGPGGRPVLIERPEYGIPPTVTKDGVTVFRSLGFQSAVQQVILETARDCAVRTAAEAGDGTTTSTILFEALTRLTLQFCEKNPSWSPQRVVSLLAEAYASEMAPELDRLALFGDLSSDEGRRRLRAVAAISANGDEDLADAVLKCYDICGDDGNVTIVDATGTRANITEKIDGYPIPMGYERSCQRYAPMFVNRQETQQVVMDKPIFILNFGRINDMQTLTPILVKLQQAWGREEPELETPNVVVVATGFSDMVLTMLANNWAMPDSINVFPLVVPTDSPVANAQRLFLDDLAAVTAGVVFDPMTHPVEEAQFEELGNLSQDLLDSKWKTGDSPGIRAIEVGRYRTTVLGYFSDGHLLQRVEIVKAQLDQSASQLETEITKERLAKLTGGIAKLTIRGASNGEVKERRDRAEDAICAVRGALRSGCLPGGGWALLHLATKVTDGKLPEEVAMQIAHPALVAPFQALLDNVGIHGADAAKLLADIHNGAAGEDPKEAIVYNALTGQKVNALETGLLDSLPAVKSALENAISISVLLGTLGAVVVQPRDNEIDKQEARDASEFNRNLGVNPADER
jgi:chaperonin GroEL